MNMLSNLHKQAQHHYYAIRDELILHFPKGIPRIERVCLSLTHGARLTLNENVLIRAGSLAYTSLISLIPAIIVMLYALNLCFDKTPILIMQLEHIFATYLLPSTARAAVATIFEVASQVSGNISLLGLLALLFTILLMARETETHIQALCKTSTKFTTSVMHYFSALISSGLLVGLIYGIMYALSSISLIRPYLLMIDIPFLMLIGFYVVVLRIFSGYHLSWKSAIWGSFIAGAGLTLSWKVCNYYFAKSAAYAAYGALIYVPTILLWIYIVWCCILFGAAVAAAYEDLYSAT